MRDLFRRYGILCALLGAMLLLYFAGTRPAIERNRRLKRLEYEKRSEVTDLQRTAFQMKVRAGAILDNDSAVIEREIRDRLHQTAPDEPSDSK